MHDDKTPQYDRAVEEDRQGLLWELFSIAVGATAATPKLRDIFTQILDRYAEPHRRYHTAAHIAQLGAEFYRRRSLIAPGDHKAMAAAIIFHDVIYNCNGRDEQDSAAFAEKTLAYLNISESIIQRTISMILATKTHTLDKDDFSTALFLDMDMEILAAPPYIYDNYVKNVTYEYCTCLKIDTDTFRQLRAKHFLTPTLLNKGIYKTDIYKKKEKLALENLQRELEASAS